MPAQKPKQSPQSFQIRLIFWHSKSRTIHSVLRNAAAFRGFKRTDDPSQPHELVVEAAEYSERHEQLIKLWETVKNWRGSALMLDGNEVSLNELRRKGRVLVCNGSYRVALDQATYCNHDGRNRTWGCRFHKGICLEMPEGAWEEEHYKRWYHFGEFESEDVWRIDKAKLKETLAREAALESLELCDVYDAARVNAAVDELPDVINLTKDTDWVAVEEDVVVGSAIQRRRVRVAPKWTVIPCGSHKESSNSDLLDSLTNGEEEDQPHPIGRQIPEVKFAHIGGIDPILQTVREVVELPLKQPQLFDRLGIKPHRGILLHGPPGCGKTLIAKAIANEVGAHFIDVAGPEILSKWVGESESNLRQLFTQAMELQPTIIFFDEIDAIAQRRSGHEVNRHAAQVVNQILTLMDGVRNYGAVTIIASTNRPDLIDAALLRPGRFDYQIEIPLPDRAGCRQILDIVTRSMPITASFDRASFADRLVGLSGADIAFIGREAAYNCLRGRLNVPAILGDQSGVPLSFDSLIVACEDFEIALRRLRESREKTHSAQ
jgi:AAA+ superfamily predicted ATPase